jgi:hypothetical protein
VTADATRWYEVAYDSANEAMKRKVAEFNRRIPEAGAAPGGRDLAADFLLDLANYLVTHSLYAWINQIVRKAIVDALALGETNGVLPEEHELFLISHSLGTVVSYETLHAIIDSPQVPGLSSGAKVRAWLTMGSPLAFIKARENQIPSLNPDFALRRGAINRPRRQNAFTGESETNVMEWFNFQQKFDPVASLVPLTFDSSNGSLSRETFVFDEFHTGANPHDFANYVSEYRRMIMEMLRG